MAKKEKENLLIAGLSLFATTTLDDKSYEDLVNKYSKSTNEDYRKLSEIMKIARPLSDKKPSKKKKD